MSTLSCYFQRAVLKIGNYLIILAVALVAVIAAASLLRGDPVLTTLQFALVLTVAAIPVAMPTVLSVTMAVGARLLASRQRSRAGWSRSRNWPVWTCFGQDRNPTQNSLTLGEPFTVGDGAPPTSSSNGALASRADNDDPIDLAVLGGLTDTTLSTATRSPTSNRSTRSTSAPRPPSPCPTPPPSRSARVPRR